MRLLAPVSRSGFADHLLPKLAPMAQWHLLDSSFESLRVPGPGNFLPVLGGMAMFVVSGRVWCLAWLLAILASIALGTRVAADYDMRTSAALASTWARRYAFTRWGQALALGAGGWGALADDSSTTCLLVVLSIGPEIVRACTTATIRQVAQLQLMLIGAPLVAACLLHGSALFLIFGCLMVLHGMFLAPLAALGVDRIEALAEALVERGSVQNPLAGHLGLAPAAADFQRLLGRDQATGLPNRHSFAHLLAQESDRAFRAETPLSLLLVGWDEFDSFHDTRPPAALDQALSDIAKRLRTKLRRPTDVLASLGGGRFAALMPGTDAFGATIVARNLQEAMWRNDTATAQAPALSGVRLSVGAATYVGKGLLPEAQLMEFAETALRSARANGGNQIRRYDPTAAVFAAEHYLPYCRDRLHPLPYSGEIIRAVTSAPRPVEATSGDTAQGPSITKGMLGLELRH